MTVRETDRQNMKVVDWIRSYPVEAIARKGLDIAHWADCQGWEIGARHHTDHLELTVYVSALPLDETFVFRIYEMMVSMDHFGHVSGPASAIERMKQ